MVEGVTSIVHHSETRINYDGNNRIYILNPELLKWANVEVPHNPETPKLSVHHLHTTSKQRKLLTAFYQNSCVAYTTTELIKLTETEDYYSSTGSILNSVSILRRISNDFGFRIYSSDKNQTFNAVYIAIPNKTLLDNSIARIPFPGLQKVKDKTNRELNFDLEPLLSWYLLDEKDKHLFRPMKPRETAIFIKILASWNSECNIEELLCLYRRNALRAERNLHVDIHRLNTSLERFEAPFRISNDRSHTYFVK